MLDPVLAFCISILQTPPEQRDCRKKDGALHVLGSVYEVLMKKVRICTLSHVCIYIYSTILCFFKYLLAVVLLCMYFWYFVYVCY